MDREGGFVPPPVPVKPSWDVVQVVNRSPKHDGSNTSIVFDLETTGLSYVSDQITTIAAASVDGQKLFNVYILPKKPIPKEVVEITGLEIRVLKGVRCMFYNGSCVETVALQTGIESFLQFLKTFETKIILVGHNCLRFDMAFLYEALAKTGVLSQFKSIVCAVVDTLYVLKKAMPGRKSYKQQVLVQEVLQEDYVAHNALEDVKALAKLVCAVKKSYIQSHTYTLTSVLERVEYNRGRKKLQYSLYPLGRASVLDESMIKKMADSGIGFSHLEEAYTHGKDVSIRKLLLGEPGHIRVPCDKNTIDKLCLYFRRKLGSDADVLADQLADLKM